MLKRLRYFLFFVFVGINFSMFATHNRAGEITYKYLGNFTYEIKLVTYTKDSPSSADRCKLTIFFGDGDSAQVQRSNGLPAAGTSECPNSKQGVVISPGIRENVYIVTHQYGGAGDYIIRMFDRNRNQGVINVPNSVNHPFYIESFLSIGNFSGNNNSAVLLNPPIDEACLGVCFYHNPGAYDPDGDSLSYELTTCRGEDAFGGIGATIPGFSQPNVLGGGNYYITNSGTLTWCSPGNGLQGEYNAAFIIKEWRKNLDGEWKLVGYVLRDLQITVHAGCNNNPPVIKSISDTCVVAGVTVTKTITATDDAGQTVTLTATGGPFAETPSAAFSSVPSTGTVTGYFSWQTTCDHVRQSPYQVTIKAVDNSGTVQLVDFKTYNITVVGPPPVNLTATPLGTSIKLVWGKSACFNVGVGNKVVYYFVYRKNDCNPWIHGPCETGVPPSSGFTFIGGTASINDTTFLDNNGGAGLAHGTNYSYIVAAVYADGSYSYASNQVCAKLKRDIPIMVNVDVLATNTSTGQVFIRWVKPLPGSLNLDTVAVPGPYEFRLSYRPGNSGAFTQIYSVSKPNYSSINQASDTSYTHSGLNTVSNMASYKLDFYANNVFVGSAQTASSVFLSLTPADRKMYLSWTEFVPWTNVKYRIFRKDPGQSTYTLRDSTSNKNYTDSNNLVNRATYCYYIEAHGEYSDPTIDKPLKNKSQEVCASPKDLTPPCGPSLNITSDCLTGFVQLTWNNPNHTCADDVIKYNLYFKPTEDDEVTLIDSIKTLSDTVYVFDGLNSIAGCYVVTAVDSSGNESSKAETECVDNCPEFELPNIVTMNNDKVNDFFKAIKVRYIKEIDLKVYNRWGNLVYETTDPYFKWDGTVIQTKQLCSEGTYFYICDVFEIRVKGTKKRTLNGWFQVAR